MTADALPGNAGQLVVTAADLGALAAVPAGPADDQSDRARAAAQVAAWSGAQGQGRDSQYAGDTVNPQLPERRYLPDAIASTDVGDDTAAAAMPGRSYAPFTDELGQEGFA